MIASILFVLIGAARAESPYLLVSEAEAKAMKASPLLREKIRSLCEREIYEQGTWPANAPYPRTAPASASSPTNGAAKKP